MTRTPTITAEDIVKGAASVARDAADGRLTPADLEAQLETELRALVGTVVGPGDPLFDLQCDIARGVLAVGGLPTDELAEWLAVARHRAGEAQVAPAAPEAPVADSGANTPPEAVSPASGTLSPESGDAEPVPALRAVPDPDPKPTAPGATSVAGQYRTEGGYDPLAGWQPGARRR